MAGKAGEHVGEPGARIDVVELCRFDEGVHRRGAAAALVRAGERLVPPSNRDAAQGAFGGVVRQADPAVVEEAGEGEPALEQIVDGVRRLRLGREPDALLAHSMANSLSIRFTASMAT